MRRDVRKAFDQLAAEIRRLSGVEVAAGTLTDRARLIGLAEPGEWSANRSCRMVRAFDGWLAVNLPRASDLELLPAWLGCGVDGPPWSAVAAVLSQRPAAVAAEDGQRLGLAVAQVGSVSETSLVAPATPIGGAGRRRETPRVVDLSSLWAGPLCGMLLANAGAEVLKIESVGRPDGARATPAFFDALNAGKSQRSVKFGGAELHKLLQSAEVVITSARPRAFEQIGLTPEAVARSNPGVIWVAVTAYGWRGPWRGRVGFGDDAAAAGGLVNWVDGAPRFEGDAIADPLTGLSAAAAVFRALGSKQSVLVDAALAGTAAAVAGQAHGAAA